MNLPDNIHITEDIQNSLHRYFQENKFDKIAVLVDENTERDCYPFVESTLPPHQIIRTPSGEIHKNLTTCTHIWNEMTQLEMSRKSLLINLGGGVIGDMGGFCARTYKRGIFFINIPTTLLSQVDASVGGKLAVDFEGFKNHIGLFSNPDLVMIDPVFLNTLPQRELISGFAEILKHGLIADKPYWKTCAAKPISELEKAALIKHSVGIKSKVVLEDPTEKGKRKILNFGHTLGHAIESFYLDSDRHLLHGEAVAAGMITEAFLSHQLTGLSLEEMNEINNTLSRIFPKVSIPKDDIESILDLCFHDKKNVNGKLMFSLLTSIGDCTFDIEVSREMSGEALSILQ
jgi:3-dehydroquinate synthase